jgi:hypothetical protein
MTRWIASLAATMCGVALVPGAGAGTGVTVTVAPDRAHTGTKITVTLANGRASRILVPGGRDWCSFFTLERWAAGRWQPARACPSAPEHLFAVAAGRRQDGVFALAGGPLVGRSGPPGVLIADLRTLPVTPLPKPGDRPVPAEEVPLGILPGGQPVRAALEPARYRVAVRYWPSRARGPLIVARSRPFVVVG